MNLQLCVLVVSFVLAKDEVAIRMSLLVQVCAAA